MRVLIADDEESMRELVTLYLSRLGVEVKTAIGGIEAEEVAMQNPFDVILLDIMMPVQNGWQTLWNLRARGYKGRIVMFTALRESEYISRAAAEGANGCLNKAALSPKTLAFALGLGVVNQ